MPRNKEAKRATTAQRGFTILELIVSVAILTTVIGVVTSGITQIEKKEARATSTK